MKVVTLVSSVNQNIEELAKQMHLQTDAVITCQCDLNDSGEFFTEYGRVIWERLNNRGVGINRNTCIANADRLAEDEDICLISDEDIVYDDNYFEAILEEYDKHPEADAILFNMRVSESRRTYWNEDYKKIHFYNYGRYPAYSISIRKSALQKSGVLFPLEFGGGTTYINGEDSVFLHDLLKAKVKMYRSPVCLGAETERESTWFNGYNERFFISRGALYVRLYGHFCTLMAWVFLLRHRYMTKDIGFGKALNLMKQGIKEISNR